MLPLILGRNKPGQFPDYPEGFLVEQCVDTLYYRLICHPSSLIDNEFYDDASLNTICNRFFRIYGIFLQKCDQRIDATGKFSLLIILKQRVLLHSPAYHSFLHSHQPLAFQ